MRPIKQIHGDKAPHWVGDGFFVKTLINYVDDQPDFNYSHTDPFLLFDYGEPTTFAPNPDYQTQPHGIGKHPHKGFETRSAQDHVVFGKFHVIGITLKCDQRLASCDLAIDDLRRGVFAGVGNELAQCIGA